MKRLIYIVVSVSIFLPNMASASFGPRHIFDDINRSILIGLNYMHLNYREAAYEVDPDLPKGVIEDYGNAFGVAMNYRDLFFERMFVDLGGEYQTGSMQYDGSGYDSVNKKYVLSKHKNTQSFINVDAKVGPIIFDNEYFQVIPYGGLGYHYWSQGSNNSYYHFKALVGGKINFALCDTFVFSPYFNFGTTIMPRAKAKSQIGTKITHRLGKKEIREIGIEVNYRWDTEIFLTGTLSHSHFEYGRSAPTVVAGFNNVEPNSKTNELRVGLGIRFGFI